MDTKPNGWICHAVAQIISMHCGNNNTAVVIEKRIITGQREITMPGKYTTQNLISIIALISIGLTAMSLPLRYSITCSVCLRFHRHLQW